MSSNMTLCVAFTGNIDFSALSPEEIEKISEYTMQKINSYPAEYGISDDYFDILFPCEVESYIIRKKINQDSSGNFKCLKSPLTRSV